MKDSNLRWWVLLTVIVGTFLGRLDQTIVNLALPKIIDDFSITVSAAGWIATAYILANAVFVPVWGKLGDTIGRKKVYILGFTIFIFGSILAGLSWSLNSLIVFRVIQAIAGSADYPTAMAIIAVTFRVGRERAQALGLWSTAFAAASVFGPLIGGPLIDTFGWRSIFLMNLPVGIVGLVMAIIFVRESVSDNKTLNFDIWGALTLGIMLSALVLLLDKGVDWGWVSGRSFITFLVFAISGWIFYRIDSKHPEPIVDFKFFKNSIFVGALANNFIIFMGLMGGVFLIPIFAQTFLGYDATTTGYLFIPMAFFMVISASIGGRLVGVIKSNYVIAFSTLIGGIGIFMFSFLDARSTALDVIIPLSIMASGIGLGMSQRTAIIASAVPQSEIGVASSVLALARNIAGAFGIAIFATVLNSSIESKLLEIARYSTANIANPLVYRQAAALIILKAQVAGYASVYVLAATIIIIGAVFAIFMKVGSETGPAPEMMVE